MTEESSILLSFVLFFGFCLLRPVTAIILSPALLGTIFCAFFGRNITLTTLLSFLALLAAIPVAALLTGNFLERALLLPRSFAIFSNLFPLLILLQLIEFFDGNPFQAGVYSFARTESLELGLPLFLYVVGKTVSLLCGIGIALFLLLGSWGVIVGLLFPERAAHNRLPGFQTVLLPMAVLLLAIFGEIIGEALLGRVFLNIFTVR